MPHRTGPTVPMRGMVIGLSIGTCEAIAGAYKDGSIEGFYWLKFAKSPVFGMLGGDRVRAWALYVVLSSPAVDF